MSEPIPNPTPPDPNANVLRARQKSSVYLAMTLLVLCAIAVIALPPGKMPLAFRVLFAAGNVLIAAVLWVVVRQKFDGK